MNRAQTWTALRIAVVAALFVITVINYLDRQSLSLLAPVIQKQLSLADRDYAHIVTAFLVAYTAAYLFAGWLTDKLGAGKSMVLFVVWWSLAEMVPPFARSGRSLGAGRFLLGLGEAGNYVAAPKAIGQWFAPEDRALAIGIYTAGATIGATLAPLLVASLSVQYGWRSVFFVTGLAGLLWTAPWILLYRRMAAAAPATTAAEARTAGTWKSVLRRHTTWCLLIARFLTDPVWYFFLFWYPKYMMDVRHLTVLRSGHVLWIVYLAADIGTLLGGYLSGGLIRRGATPLIARRRIMTVAACLTPLGPLAAMLPSIAGSISIAALVSFAHMAWLVTLTALIVDEFPAAQVGTAAGLIAAGSGLGGILSTELIGWAVTHSGYLSVFFVMSVLHLFALFFLWQIREAKDNSSSELPYATNKAVTA